MLVDLLEVDGKLVKVIVDADESFDCEKLLNPVEVIIALRNSDGKVKTIES